jgi:hypothetical protein
MTIEDTHRPAPAAGAIRPAWIPLIAAAAVLAGLVAVRSPALAMVAATGALVALVGLRTPNIAIYAVLFLLYANWGAVGVQFHGVPKPIAGAFPLLLAIPLARDIFLRREPLILTPAFLVLLLFLAVQTAGTLFAHDTERSFDALQTLLFEGVAVYLLITNVVRSKAILRGATWSLLLAGIPMSVFPIHQQLTRNWDSQYGGLAQVEGLGFRTGEVDDEGGGEVRQMRLCGPVGEKNRYAQVMLLLVPLGLILFWGERSRLLRWLALTCTLLVTVGFVLAFSRGGALGLLALVACMMLMRIIDARRLVFVAAGCMLVLAALPQYWNRLASIGTVASLFSEDSGEPTDGAVKGRITEMWAAARVFLDHPLVGVGPGMFKSYAQEYSQDVALKRLDTGRRAHNLYLEIAAENGALGLAAFLGMLLMTLAGLGAVRRELARRDPELANLATAYLLSLVAYASTGMFLHIAYIRYFFIILALGGAACHLAAQVREESPDEAGLAPVGGPA